MSFATADDGVRLHYEEAGEGTPILFIHEFAGDHRSWEPQVRFFSRRYRCITYAARGYTPSDVPDSLDAYSQAQAVADAVAVLDHAGIERALRLSSGCWERRSSGERATGGHPSDVSPAVEGGRRVAG